MDRRAQRRRRRSRRRRKRRRRADLCRKWEGQIGTEFPVTVPVWLPGMQTNVHSGLGTADAAGPS